MVAALDLLPVPTGRTRQKCHLRRILSRLSDQTNVAGARWALAVTPANMPNLLVWRLKRWFRMNPQLPFAGGVMSVALRLSVTATSISANHGGA
jgi:hypothetical protein